MTIVQDDGFANTKRLYEVGEAHQLRFNNKAPVWSILISNQKRLFDRLLRSGSLELLHLPNTETPLQPALQTQPLLRYSIPTEEQHTVANAPNKHECDKT